MKNQLIQKFEVYLAKAILEIKRLETLLLESRMREAAYEISLNRKCNPVEGKKKASERRVKELLKSMGIK